MEGAGLIQVWNVVAKHNIRGSGVAVLMTPSSKDAHLAVWGLWAENNLNLCNDKGAILLDGKLTSQYVRFHHYYIIVGVSQAIW